MKSIPLILLLITLSACGGGGGNDDNTQNDPNGLKWDEGKWSEKNWN